MVTLRFLLTASSNSHLMVLISSRLSGKQMVLLFRTKHLVLLIVHRSEFLITIQTPILTEHGILFLLQEIHSPLLTIMSMFRLLIQFHLKSILGQMLSVVQLDHKIQPSSSLTPHGRKLVSLVPKQSELKLILLATLRLVLTLSIVLHMMQLKMHGLRKQTLILVQT